MRNRVIQEAVKENVHKNTKGQVLDIVGLINSRDRRVDKIFLSVGADGGEAFLSTFRLQSILRERGVDI